MSDEELNRLIEGILDPGCDRATRIYHLLKTHLPSEDDIPAEMVLEAHRQGTTEHTPECFIHEDQKTND